MSENLKKRLVGMLRTEAELLVNDDRFIVTKLEEMNDIQNMLKIIDNYTELEPVLKDFFDKKANKEKWGSKEENEYEK